MAEDDIVGRPYKIKGRDGQNDTADRQSARGTCVCYLECGFHR